MSAAGTSACQEVPKFPFEVPAVRDCERRQLRSLQFPTPSTDSPVIATTPRQTLNHHAFRQIHRAPRWQPQVQGLHPLYLRFPHFC
ncbi:hypothetical protein SMACR_12086 [Sordaria macrospora]|uniref:Uncharacterized protein n=1 Tax=Sordaria macrospora TaxID=5147 RepID=A0A8S9A5S7_SORMA|nr:hypothetical protein SMACR_12086 [Sordaria macrospora]